MRKSRCILLLFLSAFILNEGTWVLCQTHELPKVRSEELSIKPGKPGFSLLIPTQTGVQFTNTLDEWSNAANRVLENGSGVALGDFDRDGAPDLFLCSLSGGNKLYRNVGNWKFMDATPGAELAPIHLPARGAVFADLNGDGSLDLLIATLTNGIVSLTNDATGHFKNASGSVPSSPLIAATTLALADINGDKAPDLFAATYRTDDIRDRARIDVQRVAGRVTVAPSLRDRISLTENGLIEFGDPDLLYRNDGSGRFADISNTFLDENGVPLPEVPRDWGLAAAFRDINADGAPDLYVCNDYWTPDRFWINTGAGSFRALPRVALRQTPANSMGVDFADINRDGYVDFLVTDMLARDSARQKRQVSTHRVTPAEEREITARPQYMRNMLFLNRGDETFAEIGEYAGISATDWSWQPVFIDVDLDGFEDLIIPAGYTRDAQDADTVEKVRTLQHPWPKMDPQTHQREFTRELMEHARMYPRLDLPIFSFRNRGDLTFEEMTPHWVTGQPAIHQGIAFGDLDGDGDLDFVVNNLNSAAGVFRNDCDAPRVAVRLIGKPPNTGAIGAQVSLKSPGLPAQTHEVSCGGKYLSGFEPLLVFAAGKSSEQMLLEIRWPGGKQSLVRDVRRNQKYEVEEPD